MPRIQDRSLFYFYGVITTIIALLLGMLFSAPPLVAEDIAPESPESVKPLIDAHFEGMLGTWEGRFSVNGKPLPAEIDSRMDLNGQWLKMTITTFSDSAHQVIEYQALVYIRPAAQAGIYRAYLVDNQGSGQLGQATVNHGVWSWVWEWDDGTREIGTMVTSLPNRMTYESRINDKSGHPLPSIEFDLTKLNSESRVGR